MYKKFVSLLLLGNLIVLGALVCLRGIEVNRLLSTEAFRLNLEDALSVHKIMLSGNSGPVVVSGQRVVQYDVLIRQRQYQLSKEDYEVLLRIVEAEATGEGEEGKLLVANVVLNRVKSDAFPDTVSDVVFQKNGEVAQFSPVQDGRYYEVKVSEETIRAVERALMGEDISEGALYFAARKYADEDQMKWFDETLIFLFSYGNHEFFK